MEGMCFTPYPGTHPFAYPIPCPGGYEGMVYGTSKDAGHRHLLLINGGRSNKLSKQ